MEAFLDSLNQGRAHLAAGDCEGARASFQAALDLGGGREAHEGLGRALAALGRYAEAVACFGRILEAAPGDARAAGLLAEALGGFGRELVRMGELGKAEVCFQQALMWHADPAYHLGLGETARARGDRAGAILHFERAVGLDPACVEALLALGTLHAQVNDVKAAVRWYRWALSLDPGLEEANFNLASLLEGEARLEEAQILRRRVPRPMPLAVEEAPAPRRRVLVPWGAGSGNVPIDTLMPRATTTRVKWMVECATDEQEAGLPDCDVVFNGIGNADVAGCAFERLARFHARRPMLNPPERILRTRRDLMPALLEGIPGLVVPKVARLRRDEVRDPGLAARLEGMGFGYPLLVRPIGTQGGHGACRVDRPEQLGEATEGFADAFYIIAFHDLQAADGHYRKYRMIFVDRVPYPYHLAISRRWLVHYQSADMLEAPWKREEEKAFMLDPQGTLGRPAFAAVEAAARRLDLDYGGIDFALTPEGQVLVFEANATMLAHLDVSVEDYPYKHQVVPAIFEAFEAMMARAGEAR